MPEIIFGLKKDGIIAPDERLPTGQTLALGVQHVVAMFGSTILAPLLMGFDPNVAILMSGIGTLIFFFIVGGHVPSYLGSSFAFIGVVIAATGYTAGSGLNANIGVALGGIIACGLIYALVGLIVMSTGVKWIEKLMPPVVTGAVVAVIGLNLAPTACKSVGTGTFNACIAIITMVCVGAVAVYTRGLVQKLLILVGIALSYVIYFVLANILHFGPAIDFSVIANAAWFGLPHFSSPSFDFNAILLITPVVIILIGENLGHVKAVTAMTGRNLDPYMGRAFLGDGLATMFAASFGGTGVTTYGENIGVMAIPQPLLGGVSIVVFGLIAVAGARIWVVNQVDFGNNRNLIVAAVTLILGAGDFTINIAGFTLGGIGTATFGAILLNALMNQGSARDGEPLIER